MENDVIEEMINALYYDARVEAERLGEMFNSENYKWELGSDIIIKLHLMKYQLMYKGYTTEMVLRDIVVTINYNNPNVIKLWKEVK